MQSNDDRSLRYSLFSPELNFPLECKIEILSKLSSKDLIAFSQTNKALKTLATQMLFEKEDELSLVFQQNILINWFEQLCNGLALQALFKLSEISYWQSALKGYLKEPKRPLILKLYYVNLLKCLYGHPIEDIKSSFLELIAKVTNLPTSQMLNFRDKDKELQKYAFLESAPLIDRSQESIDALLDSIENKLPTLAHLKLAFKTMSRMTPYFSEAQLIRALTLCLAKANSSGDFGVNHAHDALLGIIKQIPRLPLCIQNFCIETVEEMASINSLVDPFSFRALLHFANSDNPSLLNKIENLIMKRLANQDKQIRRSVYPFIPALATKLSRTQGLLDKALEAAYDDPYFKGLEALEAVASKLSQEELSEAISKYLPLLDIEKEPHINKSFKIIGILASHLLDCPTPLILKLMDLRHNHGIKLVLEALKKLKPNRLFISEGFIDLVLEFDGQTAFKWIFELAESMTEKEVDYLSSNFVFHQKDGLLMNQAIAKLSKRFTKKQLDVYIDIAKSSYDCFVAMLAPLPAHILKGKIDNFLIAAFEYPFQIDMLPSFVPFLQGDTVEIVFAILLKQATNPNLEHVLPSTIQKIACLCLKALAPKLNYDQLTKAKNAFSLVLNSENPITKKAAFEGLSIIVHRFKNDAQQKIIDKLVACFDSHEDYDISIIAPFLNEEAHEKILAALLERLAIMPAELRADTCHNLSILGTYVSISLKEKIISAFIGKLNANPNCNAIEGIMKLSEFINKEAFISILKAPAWNFEVLALQYLLTASRGLHLESTQRTMKTLTL